MTSHCQMHHPQFYCLLPELLNVTQIKYYQYTAYSSVKKKHYQRCYMFYAQAHRQIHKRRTKVFILYLKYCVYGILPFLDLQSTGKIMGFTIGPRANGYCLSSASLFKLSF